jgi:hypothetical protein
VDRAERRPLDIQLTADDLAALDPVAAQVAGTRY